MASFDSVEVILRNDRSEIVYQTVFGQRSLLIFLLVLIFLKYPFSMVICLGIGLGWMLIDKIANFVISIVVKGSKFIENVVNSPRFSECMNTFFRVVTHKLLDCSEFTTAKLNQFLDYYDDKRSE